MNISEREMTEVISDTLIMTFDALVDTLAEAPPELTAREAARHMKAARQELTDKLAAAFAEELRQR